MPAFISVDILSHSVQSKLNRGNSNRTDLNGGGGDKETVVYDNVEAEEEEEEEEKKKTK